MLLSPPLHDRRPVRRPCLRSVRSSRPCTRRARACVFSCLRLPPRVVRFVRFHLVPSLRTMVILSCVFVPLTWSRCPPIFFLLLAPLSLPSWQSRGRGNADSPKQNVAARTTKRSKGRPPRRSITSLTGKRAKTGRSTGSTASRLTTTARIARGSGSGSGRAVVAMRARRRSIGRGASIMPRGGIIGRIGIGMCQGRGSGMWCMRRSKDMYVMGHV